MLICYINSTTLTAITPESFTAGAVDVDVYTSTNSFNFPSAFTYLEPTITSISPSEGLAIGGTPITITGTLFTANTQIYIDVNLVNNFVLVDSNTITATTPYPSSTGQVGVELYDGSAYAYLPNAFTYQVPQITSITPSSGSLAGGTDITITGAWFSNDTTVQVDVFDVTNLAVVDVNTLTATTPPGSAEGSATVTLSVGGGLAETYGAFTYLGPSITSINPASGSDSGGTAVTINGTNFSSPATVDFDVNPATSVTVVDENTITAITPAGSGTVDVTVNMNTASTTLSQGFFYSSFPAPQVSTVNPQTGDSTGGLTVTITGANFQSGATVTLGTAAMNNITFVDNTTITADTPALSAGTYGVTVTNPDGKTGTLPNAFTVTQAPQGLPAGDLAPRGNPDNQLNAGDLVVMQRLVSGLDVPTSYDLLVGDVAPLNSPDGILNAGDLLLLTRAVTGQITLPPVFDTSPPQISILSPTDGSTVTQSSITVNGLLDEPADVTINSTSLGTVTVFNLPLVLNQGTNVITITATDTSNNTAVTSLTIHLDSHSPTSIDLTKLSSNIPGSGQVDFSGSTGVAEPSTTVEFTNATTSTTTSVIADPSDGSFSHLLNANIGDVVIIRLIDSAGNTSETVNYTVGASVQIVTPSDTAIIEASTANLSGLFSGTINDGIMVNGTPPCIYGNAFYINQLELQTGANNLNAELTTQQGAIHQHSISVTSNLNDTVTFKTGSDCGIAPLDVTFDVDFDGLAINQIDIDYDGDGTPDVTTTDPTTVFNHQYTVPGVYEATLWVVDSQGNNYQRRLYIVVQDEATLDAMFKQIWTDFSTAMASGDITASLDTIKTNARGFYDPILQALSTHLPEITADLSGIEKIRINEHSAEYAVLSVVNGQVKTFVVAFTKDQDGIWRIVSM